MKNSYLIAYYLPQYHPTPDNDMWWGKGFTEWTNVGKAKPLFRGHYQPKVPADLGYYDLRLPQVRKAQAEMAKRYGVDAFCYYHYWFGNSKEELELPFNEVVNSGEPNFPFCLCWANHSWYSKSWRSDGSVDNRTLVAQVYPGDCDTEHHFYRLLTAFKDHRYFKICGKNVFVIYKPFDIPRIEHRLTLWRELAKKNSAPDFCFIGVMQEGFEKDRIEQLMKWGFDKVNLIELFEVSKRLDLYRKSNVLTRLRQIYNRRVLRLPFIEQYKDVIPHFFSELDSLEECCPTIIPNWDHSPRSIKNGFILDGSSPQLFKQHLRDARNLVSKKKNKIVFLKSWNEWGEGNYVEPDLKYGSGWLEAIREEFSK